MKKTFRIFMLSALALIFCSLLVSCGTHGVTPPYGTDEPGYTNTSSATSGTEDPDDPDAPVNTDTADAEILGFSVGYLTESAYGNGSYDESAVTARIEPSIETVQYMVIDFKIRALRENGGDKTVKFEARISDALALNVAIQEAPTGKLETVKNEDGSLCHKLFYTLPLGKDAEKTVRMILKLIPSSGGDVNVSVSVSGNGDTAVKGSANQSAEFLVKSMNLAFTLQDGGAYTVSGKGSCTNDRIVIPDAYQGKPVTGIDDGAFKGCSALTSIVIPAGVTRIGKDAFLDCGGLTQISVNESNAYYSSENGVLFNKEKTELLRYPERKWGTSYSIPDGVTYVASLAFANCGWLTELLVPGSVTDIGKSAFYLCENLERITLPFVGNTLNGTDHTLFGYIFGASSYAEQAQYVPTSLKTVVVTGGSRMEERTFLNCFGLTSVTVPDTVTSIGESAFRGCSNLTGFVIPSGVTVIAPDVFYGCSSLKSVVIPDGVTAIGSSAFEGCGNLKSIDVPGGVTVIGSSAFRGCGSLTGIVIPKGVTQIGNATFENCGALTSIVLQGSVTEIGASAFRGCGNLTKLVVPDSVTAIGVSAFRGCVSLTGIVIPKGVTVIPDHAFNGCSSLKSIVIPDGVTNVGESAFSDCESLNGIVLPDGVTDIGSSAFSGCAALTAVNIPDGVTSIGAGTFFGCSVLEKLVLPDSVTSIGSGAFYGCAALTEMTVPNGVTLIGSWLFEGCKRLTSVVIPVSVTSIGDRAFYSCGALTSVAFGGTKAQWSAIRFGSDWNAKTGEYTVACTDGAAAK